MSHHKSISTQTSQHWLIKKLIASKKQYILENNATNSIEQNKYTKVPHAEGGGGEGYIIFIFEINGIIFGTIFDGLYLRNIVKVKSCVIT